MAYSINTQIGIWKKGLLLIAGILFLFLYAQYNPEHNPLFPYCPIHKFLGIKCPGCGSQRAIHQLLQGNLISAFRYNALMIISIPFLILLETASIFRAKSPKLATLYCRLTAAKSCYFILILILLYTLLRNVFNF